MCGRSKLETTWGDSDTFKYWWLGQEEVLKGLVLTLHLGKDSQTSLIFGLARPLLIEPWYCMDSQWKGVKLLVLKDEFDLLMGFTCTSSAISSLSS